MSHVQLANQAQLKGAKFNIKSIAHLPPLEKSRTAPPQLEHRTTNNINANNKELNKVLVITKNDLDRITNHLSKRQQEQDNVIDELNRKKELHQRSLALTSKWNNTIEGARKKKLLQKQIREDKEEEERRVVDLEHAKLMAEERRQHLEQARLQQYYETDKVKAFHSGLKLTEVLKERDAQVEMKKIIEQSLKEQEFSERKDIEKEYQQFLQNEIEDAIKKQMERSKLSDYHKAQINNNDVEKNKLKEQDRKETEALRQLNEQYRYERQQLDEHERHRQFELRKLYDKTIETKKKLVEAERIMDEEENEDIRAYAAAKHKMAVLRREKEYKLWREKQEKREQIIAYLGALLKQQEDDESFRIAKAAEKLQRKQEIEDYEKMKKLHDAYEDIRKHREETMKEKDRQKRSEKQEQEDEMKSKMEADYLYQVYENEKIRQRQKQQAQISKENWKDLNARKLLEKLGRQEEKDFIQEESKLLEMEDGQFEDYANRVIDYMERHNRNVAPMRKVLNQHLKSLRRLEAENQATIIKKHQVEVSTAKNLGFVLPPKPKVQPK